jgi:receptor protein-tyrosine kinase
VLVTSPGPGEGKTTTALNLATTLAASGLRVILVDGDLRQPALAGALRLSPRPGLTNVVREGVPLEEALQDSPVPNLRVLVPGPLPPNPPDFLNSQACRRVLRRLGEMADFVVIDSVPSSLLSDGLVIANEVDGVLLVARWGRTSRESLRRVVARLQATRAKPLGLCVNAMRTSGGGYGYQDYYRHYRSYGLRKELGSEGPRLAEVEPPQMDPPAEPLHASHESASLT